MAVQLDIMEGSDLIGRISNYTGPIPRVGERLYHPSLSLDEEPTNVMSVKTVTYDLLRRPDHGEARRFFGKYRGEGYVVEVRV